MDVRRVRDQQRIEFGAGSLGVVSAAPKMEMLIVLVWP